MRKIAVTAAGLVLLVGGCSGDGADEPRTDAGKGAGNDAAVDGAKAPAGAGNHVEDLGGSDVAFGSPAKYDDGLRVVVSAPEEFKPSKEATTGGQKKFVKLVVRVVNKSSEPVSPADISLMVESKGGQAGDVLDPTAKIAGPPARAVSPGGSAQWVQGFGVADPADVSVIVQAGLERAPAAFSRS